MTGLFVKNVSGILGKSRTPYCVAAALPPASAQDTLLSSSSPPAAAQQRVQEMALFLPNIAKCSGKGSSAQPKIVTTRLPLTSIGVLAPVSEDTPLTPMDASGIILARMSAG